jgi:hypothetical protein
MPLQTSGAISLNQIHVEAGGTSGTTASLNDSDIRALIGKGSGASMSFSEWYGASASTLVVVGQGQSGGAKGYYSGQYGTISRHVEGANIYVIVYIAGYTKNVGVTHTFQVQLANNNQNLGQSFFSSVQESSLGTLNTSASTYDTAYIGSVLTSRWRWTLSSAPSNWDGSGNLSVTFSY